MALCSIIFPLHLRPRPKEKRYNELLSVVPLISDLYIRPSLRLLVDGNLGRADPVSASDPYHVYTSRECFGIDGGATATCD